MAQVSMSCLDYRNSLQSADQKALYCEFCSNQCRQRTPMPPRFIRRDSDLTNHSPKLLTPPTSMRDRDRYQGRCAVRNRNLNRRTLVCPSQDAPHAPFTSPGRLSHAAPTFTNSWLLDGFKTKESILRWCQDVGQYSLRDLADATGHPDPLSEPSIPETPKDTPSLTSSPSSRPGLYSFRHSYPNIHTASQSDHLSKPTFMPCLPRSPSTLQSNEEVLVTSHNIQNGQQPRQQIMAAGRPRAHTTSECKEVAESRQLVDSSSISYLQAILRSPGFNSKRSSEASRFNQVLTLVNHFIHPNSNVHPSPSSPTSGAGKLGLRVTSDSDTLASTPWPYPETQSHHSQFCRDTPPTNPSSQMLETASDAISELALSPNVYIHEKRDPEDTLYDLVGTLTQRVHDELFPHGRLDDIHQEQRLLSQADSIRKDARSSSYQQSNDETGRLAVFGSSRGRSRRRKPVAIPVTTL